MTWEPLETAPDDGTWVFLHVPGHGTVRARRVPFYGWKSIEGKLITKATHWMHQPSPPSVDQEIRYDGTGEDALRKMAEAAAPDLLEALKNLVNSIEVHDDRAVHMALDAISKAEGK